MYKTLLDQVPLRFISSLLLHSLSYAYMQQIFGMFSEQVILKGWYAWDTTIQNITGIHRMYGMTNAKRRCREDPSLGADREAEPPGFRIGRIRRWHKF